MVENPDMKWVSMCLPTAGTVIIHRDAPEIEALFPCCLYLNYPKANPEVPRWRGFGTSICISADNKLARSRPQKCSIYWRQSIQSTCNTIMPGEALARLVVGKYGPAFVSTFVLDAAGQAPTWREHHALKSWSLRVKSSLTIFYQPIQL